VLKLIRDQRRAREGQILDLALDVDGGLATLDGPLQRAAEAEGVVVLS
jgi:hypothetical protein